jgi:hypothetical protein
MGVPLRVVLGAAGLFAAFGHLASDEMRLLVGLVALCGTAAVQRMALRAHPA